MQRTVRLLREADPGCEVIITSHDPRYQVEGARRYEPKNNVLEIDRFTAELIEDDVCFLYGDTYYAESAIRAIVETEAEDLLFFGNARSIVAVKVRDAELFSYHVKRVRDLYLQGKLKNVSAGRYISRFCICPLMKADRGKIRIYRRRDTGFQFTGGSEKQQEDRQRMSFTKGVKKAVVNMLALEPTSRGFTGREARRWIRGVYRHYFKKTDIL